MFLDLWNGDALLRLVHQNLAEQVSAGLGDFELGGEVILHLQDSLQQSSNKDKARLWGKRQTQLELLEKWLR